MSTKRLSGRGGETNLLLLTLLLLVAESLEGVVELGEDLPGLLSIKVLRSMVAVMMLNSVRTICAQPNSERRAHLETVLLEVRHGNGGRSNDGCGLGLGIRGLEGIQSFRCHNQSGFYLSCDSMEARRPFSGT